MKIEHTEINDFVEEVARRSANVLRKEVRCRIACASEQPPHQPPTTFKYAFVGTAVIEDEHGSVLIELAIGTGSGAEGEKVAVDWKAKLKETCDKHGLNLRPGRIEVW